MDAAHLIRVANACQKQGIANIAMIHDSFCCPAAVALELRKIVWDELVKMYRGRGVLAQIRDRAERDIAANPMAAALFKKKKLKLPDIPDFGFEVGPFAEYAFS